METEKVVYNVKHGGNRLGELTVMDNERQKTVILTFIIDPDPSLELRSIGARGRTIKLVFKKR